MNRIKSWIFWVNIFSWLAFFVAGWNIYSGKYVVAFWAAGMGAWMKVAVLSETTIREQREVIRDQQEFIDKFIKEEAQQ